MRKDYLIGSAALWAVILPLWLLVQSCSNARGQESKRAPANIQRLLDEAKQSRLKQVSEIEKEIKRVTSSREKIPNRQQVLKSLRSTLKALRDESQFSLPKVDFPLKKGDTGELADCAGLVLQVLGPKEMLVTLSFVTERPYGDRGIVRTERKINETIVLMRGFPTAGLADDQGMNPSPEGEAIEVTGTHTYQTLGGQSTVLVVEPFDTERLTPYLPKAKKKP